MKKIRCPTCNSVIAKSENPAFPFCSKRCQLIDLGEWVHERYSIPDTQISSSPAENIEEPQEQSGKAQNILWH